MLMSVNLIWGELRVLKQQDVLGEWEEGVDGPVGSKYSDQRQGLRNCERKNSEQGTQRQRGARDSLAMREEKFGEVTFSRLSARCPEGLESYAINFPLPSQQKPCMARPPCQNVGDQGDLPIFLPSSLPPFTEKFPFAHICWRITKFCTFLGEGRLGLYMQINVCILIQTIKVNYFLTKIVNQWKCHEILKAQVN